MGDLVDQICELATRAKEVDVPDFLDENPDPFVAYWALQQLRLAAVDLSDAILQLATYDTVTAP